jgi:signal peptidase I
MSITRDQFEMLKKLPLFKSKIVSDSMVPILNIGDEIVIDIGYKDIKRFDIIVIYLDEKLVCHYLWRMNKLVQPILLQTRNMSGMLDYPVKLENYLGKVVSHKLSLWQKLKIIF